MSDITYCLPVSAASIVSQLVLSFSVLMFKDVSSCFKLCLYYFLRLKRRAEANRGLCTRRVVTRSSEEHLNPRTKRSRSLHTTTTTTTRTPITRPPVSMTRKSSVSMSENNPREHVGQKNITTSRNGEVIYEHQTMVTNSAKNGVPTEGDYSTQSHVQETKRQTNFKQPQTCSASVLTNVRTTISSTTRFSATAQPTITSRQRRVGIVQRRILCRDEKDQAQITTQNYENHSSANNRKTVSNITSRKNESTTDKYKINSAANKYKYNTTTNNPNVDGTVKHKGNYDFNKTKHGTANKHGSNSIINDLRTKGNGSNSKNNNIVNNHNPNAAHIQRKCLESRNQPMLSIRKPPPKDQQKPRPSTHSGPEPNMQTRPDSRSDETPNYEHKDRPTIPTRVNKIKTSK